MLLPVVALLAAWNDIALPALAATNDGYNMIHRKLGRGKALTAVVADTLATPVLPPLTLPEFPRPGPLPLYLLFRDL